MKIYLYTFNSPESLNQVQIAQQKKANSIFSIEPEKECTDSLTPKKDEKLQAVLRKESERLKALTDKYNLINVPAEESEILRDAQSLSNEFIKKYGYLSSLSREEMLLQNHPELQPDESTRKKYNNMRNKKEKNGSMREYINKTANLVETYKAGNCGDCSMILSLMAYDKYDDKYVISTMNYYATVGCRGVAHVALMLISKDGNEQYVIDPWITPDTGGIFEKADWEKMIAEAYQVDENANLKIFASDLLIRTLKGEEE